MQFTSFRFEKKKICNELFFLFDGRFYHQTDGLGTGLPLGPAFANIFLCFHETIKFGWKIALSILNQFCMKNTKNRRLYFLLLKEKNICFSSRKPFYITFLILYILVFRYSILF